MWFNSYIVLHGDNFLSKMLVWYGWIWRSCRRFRRLCECDFEGGMSGASTLAVFETTLLKSQTSAVTTISWRVG